MPCFFTSVYESVQVVFLSRSNGCQSCTLYQRNTPLVAYCNFILLWFSILTWLSQRQKLCRLSVPSLRSAGWRKWYWLARPHCCSPLSSTHLQILQSTWSDQKQVDNDAWTILILHNIICAGNLRVAVFIMTALARPGVMYVTGTWRTIAGAFVSLLHPDVASELVSDTCGISCWLSQTKQQKLCEVSVKCPLRDVECTGEWLGWLAAELRVCELCVHAYEASLNCRL